MNTLLDARMLSFDAASLQFPCPCDTEHDDSAAVGVLQRFYRKGCADAVRRKPVMQRQTEGGQAVV